MPRVIHFEIAVDDPERASNFYREALGWKIEKWNGPMDYWLVATGEESEPGIHGALTRRANSLAPIVNTLNVPDLDGFVAKVISAGGKVLLPRMAVPGIGYMAYCQDSEGNPFGMMETDKEAK